jgi:cation diffusion facilitator family transporter
MKITVGLYFNTLSLISDALNSLTDIIASSISWLSIKVSYKKPDANHQFGHSRSQQVAGLIVAMFIGIVGFEILIESIRRLMTGERGVSSQLTLIVVAVVAAVKLFLYFYTKSVYRASGSVALKANMVDHRNDILISIIVFIGLFAFNLGYYYADAIAGVLISFYIIYSGYEVGMENIGYIMGKAPAREFFDKIIRISSSISGVRGLNDIRAHMLGTQVQCEIHIYVDPRISIKKAHDIGNSVRHAVEDLPEVENAFIHIDPDVKKRRKSLRF